MNQPAVWVGYLNPASGIRDVIAHFEHCGPIWQVKMMRTSKSTHPFAFLWFEKPMHARRALDMDRSILQGSIIKVRMKRMDFVPVPTPLPGTPFLQPLPPPPPPIRLSNLAPPPGASVQIMDPYTHQCATIMEGSNLARQISSLPPVHIVSPELLRSPELLLLTSA